MIRLKTETTCPKNTSGSPRDFEKMLQEKIAKKIIVLGGILLAAGTIWLILDPLAILFIGSIFLGEWSSGQMRLSVASTADDRPVITFNQSSIDYRRHPFSYLEVSEYTGPKEDFASYPKESEIMWRLKEKSAYWKRPIHTITYGVCPPEFEQLVSPKPLLIGHYYRVKESGDIIKKLGVRKYKVVRENDI